MPCKEEEDDSQIPANKNKLTNENTLNPFVFTGICNPCGRLVRISNPQIYYTGIANPREHKNENLFVGVTNPCGQGTVKPLQKE